MTEVALKRSLGLTLIAVHCISLLLAIALFFASGLTFEQLTTTAAIIAPMFAGFTTQALTFFTNSRLRSDDVSSPITRDYALLSFAFPLILGVLVWVSMIAQAYGKAFRDFEQFKLALVLFEGMFASYAAKLLAPLFGRIDSGRRRG
jgi:hypothetical protein